MSNNGKDRLCLEAGDDTEALVNFIFKELPDELVDEIELSRIAPKTGVAREPITTGAILTCGTTLTLAVIQLVRRWMEQNRQKEHMKMIFDAAQQGNLEAAKLLLQLAKDHSKVVIEFEKVRVPEVKTR
jgi:hypothetical protein